MCFLTFCKPQTSGHTQPQNVMLTLSSVFLQQSLWPLTFPALNFGSICLSCASVSLKSLLGFGPQNALYEWQKEQEILLTAPSFQATVAARLHAVGVCPLWYQERGGETLHFLLSKNQSKAGIGQGWHGLYSTGPAFPKAKP